MVLISKQEKEAVIKQIPSAHYRRTVSQKSKRHHYYLEEDPAVLSVLYKFRSEQATSEEKRNGR